MGLRLAGSVLPWKESALLALVSDLFSGGITAKIHYGVDILLPQPVLHPIFSHWVR